MGPPCRWRPGRRHLASVYERAGRRANAETRRLVMRGSRNRRNRLAGTRTAGDSLRTDIRFGRPKKTLHLVPRHHWSPLDLVSYAAVVSYEQRDSTLEQLGVYALPTVYG